MSTYAGFQRYDTPNLGQPIAAGLEKRSELDYRDQQLQEKKLNDARRAAALSAKDALKQGQESDKYNAELESKLTTAYDAAKGAIKVPDEYGTNIGAIGLNIANNAKKEYETFAGTPKWNLSSMQEKAKLTGNYISAMNSVKDLGISLSTIQQSVSDSDYVKYFNDMAINIVPNSGNPVMAYVKDGNIYAQRYVGGANVPFLGESSEPIRSKGEPINLNIVSSAAQLANKNKNNFDEDIKKQVLSAGKQEIGIGEVDQGKSKKYIDSRNRYAAMVAFNNDPKNFTDAYVHFVNDKPVILADKNEDDESIKRKALNIGCKKENEYEVLRMQYNPQTSIPEPVPTDAQRKELEKRVLAYCDARVERNIVQQAQHAERPEKDEDALIKRAISGDEGAIRTIIDIASENGNVVKRHGHEDDKGENYNKGYMLKGNVLTFPMKQQTDATSTSRPTFNPESYELSDQNLPAVLKKLMRK